MKPVAKIKARSTVGAFKFVYLTTNGVIPECNGFSFDVRADTRGEADLMAAAKAKAMMASAAFVKVI